MMLSRIPLWLVSPLMLATISCAAPVASSDVTRPATRTYIDNEAGFAFDYPADWYRAEFPGSRPYGFGLTTYDPDFPPTDAAVDDPTLVSINIGVLPPAADITTVHEWAAVYRQELDAGRRTVEAVEDWMLPSGLAAVRFRLESRSGSPMDTILVMVNDRRIVIGAKGSFELLSRVLDTFRPA